MQTAGEVWLLWGLVLAVSMARVVSLGPQSASQQCREGWAEFYEQEPGVAVPMTELDEGLLAP